MSILPARSVLEDLALVHGQVYKAGLPGYQSNFSRDSLTYGLLANDLDALEAQIAYSAEHQGLRRDAISGEEPGKIHHECPGVLMRGRETTYNACDTTALFLIAIARVAPNRSPKWLKMYRPHITRALRYITSHLHRGIFYEDPHKCGAERFALKVTYWKDSELNDVEKEPVYPIAYSLVHFQNAEAVRAMGQLLNRKWLLRRSERMLRRGLEFFWRDDHFIIARDGNGRVIDAPSSDSLHSLLYIDPEEIEPQYPSKVVAYSEQLVTRTGYLPAIRQVEELDTYHTDKVWVHEQALLHAAARRHDLQRAQEVAGRIIGTLEKGFPELVDPTEEGAHAGNTVQLWSIGAYLYFKRLEAEVMLGAQLQVRSQLPTSSNREIA